MKRSTRHRRSKRRRVTVQRLEERRLLAVTASDEFTVSLDHSQYRAGATVIRRDVVSSTLVEDIATIDLTDDRPGHQIARLGDESLSAESAPASFDPQNVLEATPQRILVDPDRTYVLEASTLHTYRVSEVEVGYAAFDSDGLRIEPSHVNRFEGAQDTYLLEPIDPCGHEIVVADASGWSNDLGSPEATRAIAYFGYAGADGQTYDDFTYTRHVIGRGDRAAWGAESITYDAAVGGYRITLTDPWSGPQLAAGAAIRNAVIDDGTFQIDSEVHGQPRQEEGRAYAGGAYSTQQSFIEARFGGAERFPPGTQAIQIVSNTALSLPTVRFAADITDGAPARFDGDVRIAHDGSLELIESDQLYVIDPAETYHVRALAHRIAGEPTEKHSIGVTAFDVDGRRIEPKHATSHPGSADARLLSDLNAGDNFIVMDTTSGWNNSGFDPAARNLAWFGYASADGTTYPDFTYTRNVTDAAGGLWDIGGIQGNVIVLREPWSGPSLAAGTVVRNAGTGDAVVPLLLDRGWLGDAAEVFHSGPINASDLPAGTASIRAAARINQSVLEHDATVVLESFGISTSDVESVLPAGDQYSVLLDVLGNDQPGMQLHAVSEPRFGSAAIEDGRIRYTAPAFFTGSDRFLYTVTDPATGEQYDETVSVALTGTALSGDSALVSEVENWIATEIPVVDPIANDDPLSHTSFAYSVISGETLRGAPGAQPPLTYNDSPDGSNHSWASDGPRVTWLLSPPEHGSLSLRADGTFEYESEEGFSGNDHFRYAIFDGVRIDSAVAAIVVEPDEEALLHRRLKEISNATHSYHSAYKSLTPGQFGDYRDEDGNQYHSWRVHLLPFLGYWELYQQFNLEEPWDSEHNLTLIDQMPDVFRTGNGDAGATTTRMQRVMQSEPFSVDYRYSFSGGWIGQELKWRDFLDQLNQTIMHVVAAPDKAVPWTQPSDAVFDPTDPLEMLREAGETHVPVSTADGAVFNLPLSVDPDDYFAMVTRSGYHLGENYVDVSSIRRQWASDEGGQEAIDAYSLSQETLYEETLAQGMQNFHSAYKQFPPQQAIGNWDENGKPRLSWRVHLLPFIGYGSLWERFDARLPWDDPYNLALVDEMPDIYRSFGDSPDTLVTRIQNLDAVGTLFGPNEDGSFREAKSSHALDGTANTAMFVESGVDKAVVWTRPDDIPFDWNNPLASLGDYSAQEAIRMILADGSRLRLPTDVDDETLTALATMQSRKYVDGVWVDDVHPIDSDSLRRRYDHLNRVPDDRTAAANRLKRIMLGMHNHHSTYKRLPVVFDEDAFDENGFPKLSWRVYLLPWMGHADLFDQFHLDEPWDSPHNLSLLDEMPDVFRSKGDSWDSTTTRIQSVTASADVLGLNSGTMLGARNGLDQGPYEGPRWRETLDGLANTLMLVEGGPETAVPWTQPTDIPFDPADPLGALQLQSSSFPVAYADGATATFPSNIDREVFGSLLLRDDRQVYPFPAEPNVQHVLVQEGELARLDVRWQDLGAAFGNASELDVVVDDPDLLQLSDSTVDLPAYLPADFFEYGLHLYDFRGEVTVTATDNESPDGPRSTRVTIGDLIYEITVVDSDPQPIGTTTIEDVVINDGDLGRSAINKVTVVFDQLVDHDQLDRAFLIHNADEAHSVAYQQTTTDLIGKTFVELAFDPATFSDGNYRLHVNHIDVAGLNSDFVFGTDANDTFFRFYGDADGDRDVDGLDYTLLARTFLRRVGDAPFDARFDFDGDGDVDGLDYTAFSQRFLKSLP